MQERSTGSTFQFKKTIQDHRTPVTARTVWSQACVYTYRSGNMNLVYDSIFPVPAKWITLAWTPSRLNMPVYHCVSKRHRKQLVGACSLKSSNAHIYFALENHSYGRCFSSQCCRKVIRESSWYTEGFWVRIGYTRRKPSWIQTCSELGLDGYTHQSAFCGCLEARNEMQNRPRSSNILPFLGKDVEYR